MDTCMSDKDQQRELTEAEKLWGGKKRVYHPDISINQEQRDQLLRLKMELAARLLDEMILGDIHQHPVIMDIVQALGRSTPSLTTVLQKSNARLMRSCLSLLDVMSQYGDDGGVSYDSFVEVFSQHLEEVQRLYAELQASENSGQ